MRTREKVIALAEKKLESSDILYQSDCSDDAYYLSGNKKQKRYSEVWLTVEDLGGIPDSDNFVINVKVEPVVTSKILELNYIGLDLFKRLDKDEIPLYWHVNLYKHDERVHHTSDDIILIQNTPA